MQKKLTNQTTIFLRMSQPLNAFLLVLLLTVSCHGPSATALPRPNILLIVADDLGFSDLGCYGSEIRTPHLDALARSGIRHTSFYTAPTCSPTRAMLLSGVDNHRNGYGTMEGDWAENQMGVRGYEGHLNFDVVAFPKLLQENGYHTSIAGKWHQAYPATEQRLWPGQRGFSRSFCLLQGGAGHFADQQRLFSFFERTLYQEDGKLVEELPADFYSSDYYTQKVIDYINESARLEQPFFSMLTFTAPHWPLQVPDEHIDLYQGRYEAGYEVLAEERVARAQQLGIIPNDYQIPPLSPNVRPWESLSAEERKVSSRIMEVYAAMIERLDANVGKLLDHLKATGQYENTLVIFMADNGAEGNSVLGIADTRDWVAQSFDNSLANIGRENSYVFTGPAWAQVSSLPFQWYKGFASEGGVRCPAIVSYPAWTNKGGTIEEDFTSVMDLAPTILELAGVPHPGTEYQGRRVFPLDGISLLSWWQGKTPFAHAPEEIHCWELYGRRGVRQGDWKAEWFEAPYGQDRWQLYDLHTDLAEQHDLARSHPEKLAELVAAWDHYATTYQVTLPNENVAYGTEEYWKE